jgi:hypothetical protein
MTGSFGSRRAAAICSSLTVSRSIASSEPVVGACKVPLGRISSSRGVSAGARNTRGVTEMTISTRRFSLVGEVKKRPSIGKPPSMGNPARPFDCTSVATLASIIVRLFCTRAVPVIVRSVKVGVKVVAPLTSFASMFIFT